MKLILSRKGFDSANGGCPSPIIDGHLCSLPIPDAGAPTSYKKISPFNGAPIAKIVEDLTCGQVRRGHRAHLDPDLRRDSIARAAGWRPMFGQAGAAQSHLARHDVGSRRSISFFRIFSSCRESRRRVPLRPQCTETSRYLRMAPGRVRRHSHERPCRRNALGSRTSSSRAACNRIRKQHSLFRERPSFVDWPQNERCWNFRPDQT